MSFDLCLIKKAEKPYYIENIGTNIYTIEELCFYLYHNVYLIDQSIVNEYLCDWLRDELGLKKLYTQMYDNLEKQEGVAGFILPIFREIGYLTPEEMRAYQDNLSRLEVQPSDMREKMKGDYLIRCGMYESAVRQYMKILAQRSPGNLGTQFYAQVWNNLGCAYARQFLFEEASECFLTAWKAARTKEMLRKYVSTLPLFLEEDEYKKRLEQLGADAQLLRRIQEYNALAARKIRAEDRRTSGEKDPLTELKEACEAYRRQTAQG